MRGRTLRRRPPLPSAPINTSGCDRTYDVFEDETVVVAPLPGDDENFAGGVFVNLVSGRSYFLIPLDAKVHSLARLPHGTRVISPEDVKSGNELTQFPQFER